MSQFLFNQTELLIAFFLLDIVENAHRRVHQVQRQTKGCVVRNSKMKQDLPLLISASYSLLSLTASAASRNFVPYKVCKVPLKTLHTKEKKTLRFYHCASKQGHPALAAVHKTYCCQRRHNQRQRNTLNAARAVVLDSSWLHI